jgi:hypothetical protein
MMRRFHRACSAARIVPATLLAAGLAAMLLSGCAGTLSGQPSAEVTVVTVTSTIPAKPGTPRPPGTPQAQPAGTPSSTVRVEPPPGAGSSGDSKDPNGPTGPVKTIPPQDRPSTGKTGGKPAGGGTSGGKTRGSTVTPPGSLSTGDLIAAATSAAAAAGVPPADPDAPGPQTGPACPADAKYVNEAPTGLRSDVITAWQRAVSTARAKGITLCLNDGKRSRAQQQAQFDEYAEQYGEEVARQLVLPPEKSAHVVGIAVDAQPGDAYRWLQSTKGSLGFCRIYDNEPWHFEYNPAYQTEGCPARLPEPEG